MNRAERRAAAARARKAPRPRRLSREDRTFYRGALILLGGVLVTLFIFITPMATGRCIKCILTGEPRCGWMEQLSQPRPDEPGEPHVHF